MLVNVPQFIGVEDKIVGPLTAKQLGWLGAGGFIMLILWNIYDTQAFIIAAIIDGVVFGALAFYRPYNQSLLTFILSSISFVFRPKVYVWNRSFQKAEAKKNQQTQKIQIVQKKTLDTKRLREISQMLDSNGKKN
jgi:hypothetical protein